MVAVAFRVHQVNTTSLAALVTPTPVYAQGGNCSLVGNNTAVPFGAGDFSEARFTLALLTGPGDIPTIVNTINGATGTVIIRLGAGKGSENLTAAEYSSILSQIASQTSKNFVATAGHNEPNCAEYIPLEQEAAFVSAVAGAVSGNGNIKLITGQIDMYCGDSEGVPGADGAAETAYRQRYLTTLAGIPGIQGVALPYYITAGTPTADALSKYFDTYAALAGKPIYITESGPFLESETSLKEFIEAVPLAVSNPGVEAFLLFNALGLNRDGAFSYTRPFWNPACREALRTQCNDPATVLKICEQAIDNLGYYIMPIEGVGTDKVVFTEAMIRQGYQVQCAAPKFPIETTIEGDVDTFRRLYANEFTPFYQFNNIETQYVIDATTANVPLFRSPAEASLFGSIEDYFGYRDITFEGLDPIQQDIASGPVYPLLDLNQQCIQKMKLLTVIEEMCGRLETPETCPLYQPIIESNYTTKDLKSSAESAGLSCEMYARGEGDEALRTGIDHMPLYLDRLYRLAFLVVTVDLKKEVNDFYNFFTAFNQNPQSGTPPDQEVIVIAFKIPDVATEKQRQPDAVGSEKMYYDDPLFLVRDAITPKESNDRRVEKIESDKVELLNKLPAEVNKPINCAGEECKSDPTVAGLVDLINKNGEICDSSSEMRFEDANQIKDPAVIESNPGTIFQRIGDITKMLFKLRADTPSRNEFNFLGQVQVDNGSPTAGGDRFREVKSYLVYPVGPELEEVENALAGLVFGPDESQSWRDAVTIAGDPKVIENFVIADLTNQVTTGNPKREFLTDDCSIDPLTGLQTCRQSSFGPETVAQTQNPRIRGAALGYMMRQIQKAINVVGTETYEFVTACKTTEEFLTGNCGDIRRLSDSDGRVVDLDGIGNGNCKVVESGPCSVANLKQSFMRAGVTDNEAAVAAVKASMICGRESGGNPNNHNKSCTFGTDGRDNDGDFLVDGADSKDSRGLFDGGTYDYSIGLFQINLIAHCRDAFGDIGREPLRCVVGNASRLNECVERFTDPQRNIEYMIQLSNNGKNWGPWSAAGPRSCGIE